MMFKVLGSFEDNETKGLLEGNQLALVGKSRKLESVGMTFRIIGNSKYQVVLKILFVIGKDVWWVWTSWGQLDWYVNVLEWNLGYFRIWEKKIWNVLKIIFAKLGMYFAKLTNWIEELNEIKWGNSDCRTLKL